MVSLVKSLLSSSFHRDESSRRPLAVVECSRSAFDIISRKTSSNSSYTFKGAHDYSFFNDQICAQEAVKAIYAKNGRCFRSFSVLDIGTGDGGFLEYLPKEVHGYGITAQDFRRSKSLSDHYYRIGNAEELTQVFPSQKFDAIVSHLAFQHFTDPLEAVKQAYAALKSGGILLIDGFNFPGIDVEEWLNILHDNGYDVAATASVDPSTGIVSQMHFLSIRKTKPAFDDHIIYADQPLKENKYTFLRAQYCFRDRPGRLFALNFPQAYASFLKGSRNYIQFFEGCVKEGVFEAVHSDVLAKIKDVLSAEDLRVCRMTDAANHQLTEWGIPLKDTDRVKIKAVKTFCGFTMRGVVATAAASSVAIAAIAAIFYQQ